MGLKEQCLPPAFVTIPTGHITPRKSQRAHHSFLAKDKRSIGFNGGRRLFNGPASARQRKYTRSALGSFS
jgi:hypothetical protein